MAVTQLDKGNSFRALHQGPRAFIIANAWDAGSARILAGDRRCGARHVERRRCRKSTKG